MPTNSDTVDAFVRAWSNLDLDAIMAHFTDDAAYANVPMGPPHVGKAAIREFIEGFIGMASHIEFIVHNQVEGSNGVVMNERTDILQMADNRIELPVMGVFEFEDGKIKAWRDYFDMASFSG